MFVYSLIVGYIYCTIAHCIPITINQYVDKFLIIVSSAIISFIFGKIVESKKYIPLFQKLRILNSFNSYLWDDLMDRNYPMKLHIEYDDCKYEGILHYFESESSSPHFALASYIVFDLDGNVKYNYSDDPTHVVVLSSANAKKIEIIYNENSQECDMINALCKYHESVK